jgi:hypothetical protein
MNSLSANFLNGVARLVNAFGDSLKDDLFKERIGAMSSSCLPHSDGMYTGSLGYAEAMLVAYNRKCKFPLRWNSLYEKNNGAMDNLDADLPDEDGDESEASDEVREE